jgi:hypothetical protein
MSNILERHLEENIEPSTNKQDYIDQAIQIFQDMKEEDITMNNVFKSGNKYCLNGLFCMMTGFRGCCGFGDDAERKIGQYGESMLTFFHQRYIRGQIDFETMRTKAIEHMRSLK